MGARRPSPRRGPPILARGRAGVDCLLLCSQARGSGTALTMYAAMTESVEATFRSFLPKSITQDSALVESQAGHTRVAYEAALVGEGIERARIHLAVPENEDTAWIEDLFVSPEFRQQGIGRQLVRAAEALVFRWNALAVNVWPLQGSHGFWEKLGYQPHECICRVMTKSVAG
ncbi:MAG: GNAT family N-acetyltransferase [Planctomycetota bacterium]|nr:MAG: GNAT family N-acetyltransferase [Planctomycetota bacterium]REK39827.1 MAG: GNAT family N-acetyltransferase [Planctomycetota bacterium]